MLAIELYRVMQEVDKLEKKLGDVSPGAPERDDLERQVKHLRSERDRIKAMMEGAKE
jgi:cell division protein FtsL